MTGSLPARPVVPAGLLGNYLVDVRGLTLRAPWGQAIARHGKDVENRTWPAPQHVDRILVHQGKVWDEDGAEVLRRRGAADLFTLSGTITCSAVVAVADIAHVCDTTVDTMRRAPMGAVWCGCGDWAVPGQYHWRLTNVVPLPTPVRCRGWQQLWKPDPAVLAAVHAQLQLGAGGG